MIDHGDRSTVILTADELERLCASAVLGVGGSEEMASTLARATVAAERRGKSEVGVAHLFDYLAALDNGRINPAAQPRITADVPAVITVDGDDGTAHSAFDLVADRLVGTAKSLGLSMLSISNVFTSGELGFYTEAIARNGLITLAGTNSPAVMSLFGVGAQVTGTNPLSFAFPHPEGPRLFDQASSTTAWVNVREAAENGKPIPETWALDPTGSPTTDARAGLEGSLQPFGGVKGSNLALMVEFLSVLSGARFSLDAAPLDRGAESPRIGLFLLAIEPRAFDPDYTARIEAHLQRLEVEFGIVFGRKRWLDAIELPRELHAALIEHCTIP